MATYKEINSAGVQNFSSDPSNLINGQVWYNTGSSVLKVAEITTTGTWGTGGNMGTARYDMGSAGTQTASAVFGGGEPITAATEEYNGSSWTAGGNMGTARRELGGLGTQTAALAFGGRTPGFTNSK